MPDQTVQFTRVLRAPASRVYRAFMDPVAMMKWLPPHGFYGQVHSFENHVGGRYRMSFTNLTTGASHGWSGIFTELVENQRIVHQDTFDDPNLPGTMQTTIVLQTVLCGTQIDITQSGIPAVIPAEMCSLGWQESLQLLTLLVEPEIAQ